jgi:hypothetical protein
MMDKGSWVVLTLKIVLITGAAAIILLSLLNKIPEWLIFFPAAPFVFFALRRMVRGG